MLFSIDTKIRSVNCRKSGSIQIETTWGYSARKPEITISYIPKRSNKTSWFSTRHWEDNRADATCAGRSYLVGVRMWSCKLQKPSQFSGKNIQFKRFHEKCGQQWNQIECRVRAPSWNSKTTPTPQQDFDYWSIWSTGTIINSMVNFMENSLF